MYGRRISSIASVLGLLIAGCSPNYDTIRGQVFIVTQGGDNVKLGLVTIALLPSEDVRKHIDSKKKELSAKRKEIEQAIEAAEASLLEAERQYRASAGAAGAASARVDKARKSQWASGYKDWEKWYAVIDKANEEVARHARSAAPWKQETEIRTATVARLQEQLASADCGPFFLEGLPDASARAQTDANGEFAVQVPRKGSFALAAHAQRRVFGSTEDYTWVVLIPQEARQGVKVLLSNETLTRGGSPLSLIHTNR